MFVLSEQAVRGSKDANESLEVGNRKSLEGWEGSRTPGCEPLIERVEGPASGDIFKLVV